jgi:hypothetical protein
MVKSSRTSHCVAGLIVPGVYKYTYHSTLSSGLTSLRKNIFLFFDEGIMILEKSEITHPTIQHNTAQKLNT